MHNHHQYCQTDTANMVDGAYCLYGEARLRGQTQKDLTEVLRFVDSPSKFVCLEMDTASRVFLDDELAFKEQVKYLRPELLDLDKLKACRAAI